MVITKKIREDIAHWIETLRSGKYQQRSDRLQSDDGFCCLGVACMEFIQPKDRRVHEDDGGRLFGALITDWTQPASPAWLKAINRDIPERVGGCWTLSDMNDGGGSIGNYNFDEIADILQLVYIEGAFE